MADNACRRPRRAAAFAVSLALCLAAAAPPARALDCLFVGTDADARVSTHAGGLLRPYPQRQLDTHCERLRVETGSVDVYAFDPASADIVRRRVSSGPLLPPGVSAAPAGSALSRLMANLQAVLSGQQRRAYASSRGDAGADLAAALPRGRLVQPREDLVLVLGPVPDPLLEAFSLSVSGRTVLQQRGPAVELRLPAAELKPGAHARWTLAYDGRVEKGEFRVEPVEALEAVRAAQPALADPAGDPTLADLREAATLGAAGFEWDARQVLEGLPPP